MLCQLVQAAKTCSLLQLNKRFILTWVPSIREHYASFRNRFLVSLVADMWDILEYIALLHFLSWSVWRFLKAESNWASRDIWFSGKAKACYWAYKLYQGGIHHLYRPDCILPMGTTTSANGPTNREVLFLFACFPCFMITVPFVLNHYCSKYWYKSSLLLINPWLRKLKPVDIPILFSRSTAVCCNTKTGSKGWSETTLHI